MNNFIHFSFCLTGFLSVFNKLKLGKAMDPDDVFAKCF